MSAPLFGLESRDDSPDNAGIRVLREPAGCVLRSTDSLILIRRAKEGDRLAWQELCQRYYPQWLAAVHGSLGRDLRQLYDTGDIVQSAIADALRDVKDLRNDALFFSWVSVVIRRKLLAKRRKHRHSPPARLDEVAEPGHGDSALAKRPVVEEEYERLLDAIARRFETHPEAMAAIYLRYFEDLDTRGLTEAIGMSERSVFRYLSEAKSLLRGDLDGDSSLDLDGAGLA